MADVHRRLLRAQFLAALSPDAFAEQAAVIVGDINYIHPFRERNGRTQLQYLKQLADRAGHRLDLAQISGDRWIEASSSAMRPDMTPWRLSSWRLWSVPDRAFTSVDGRFRALYKPAQPAARVSPLYFFTSQNCGCAKRNW